jgi:hypothetical protein
MKNTAKEIESKGDFILWLSRMYLVKLSLNCDIFRTRSFKRNVEASGIFSTKLAA